MCSNGKLLVVAPVEAMIDRCEEKMLAATVGTAGSNAGRKAVLHPLAFVRPLLTGE